MNSQTLLHRQVNPSFIRCDRITSQVFRPTPKDSGMLSVSDGDQILAEQSYRRFVDIPSCKSIGVLSVSVKECHLCDVPPVSDPIDGQPDHCFIDFRGKTNNQVDRIATTLKNHAMARGWSYCSLEMRGVE